MSRPRLKKVDDRTWMVGRPVLMSSGRRSLDPRSLFCITGYDSASHDVQLVVFEIALKDDYDPRAPMSFEITREIFTSHIWTNDIESVIERSAELFCQSSSALYPMELVNEFGGTLHGEEVPFNQIYQVLH